MNSIKMARQVRGRGYEIHYWFRNPATNQVHMVCGRDRKIGRGRVESKTIEIRGDGNVEVMGRSVKPASWLDRFLSL